MSAIYKNGIAYGGAASAANLISATGGDGTATNVQAELDTINENITSLNDDLAYSTGEGTFSNQYCTCQFWWVKTGNITSLAVNMVPAQNISTSTGSMSVLSDIPIPYMDTYGAVSPRDSLSDSTNRVSMFTHAGNITFHGPYTKDSVYRTSFTFIVAV